jgi:hypothetical protein
VLQVSHSLIEIASFKWWHGGSAGSRRAEKGPSKVSGFRPNLLVVRGAGCDRYSCGHRIAAMPERTYEMDVAGGKEICHQIKKAGEPAGRCWSRCLPGLPGPMDERLEHPHHLGLSRLCHNGLTGRPTRRQEIDRLIGEFEQPGERSERPQDPACDGSVPFPRLTILSASVSIPHSARSQRNSCYQKRYQATRNSLPNSVFAGCSVKKV